MANRILARHRRRPWASAEVPISERAPAPPGAERGAALAAETDSRARRLSEMVVGLTGCDATAAFHTTRAVLRARPDLESLEVVARAVTVLEEPRPDRFRISGPVDPAGTRDPTPTRNTEGSGDGDLTDDLICDLRAGHPRVRIDLTPLDRPEDR